MKLRIKNFSFFEDQVEFQVAPLTLLIGSNNSGKSTFLKALSLATSFSLVSRTKESNYISDKTEFNIFLRDNLNVLLKFEGDLKINVKPEIQFFDGANRLFTVSNLSTTFVNKLGNNSCQIKFEIKNFQNYVLSKFENISQIS